MSITLNEEFLIGIAISVIGTAGVGVLGWFFRTQLRELLKVGSEVPNRIYGWILTFCLTAAWIGFKIAGINAGMGFTVIVGMAIFLMLISAINRNE